MTMPPTEGSKPPPLPGAHAGHQHAGPPPPASSHRPLRPTEPYEPSLDVSRKTEGVLDDEDGRFDPVVGWLVVLNGEARGRDFRIRHGWNSIGRHKDCKIYIAFDATVSENPHAFVVYDNESNAFYVKHGEGKNPTRLNDQLVGDLTPIQGGDTLRIGKTTLLFVPLCGENFSWTGADPELD